jgi:cell division protein FtsW
MTRYNIVILLCVLLLFSMGLVMVFNTTSAEVLDRFLQQSTHHALIKQLLYALVGVIGAYGVWVLGYQNLIRLSGILLSVATVLLVLVFLPGIGQQINGAHRWLNIFGNSFQPSEFVKFLIPLYYILKTPVTLKDFLQVLARLSIPLGLILIEPDNGTVAIVLATLVILFLLTQLKWTYWALPLAVLCLVGGVVASQMPHVSARLQVYMDPEYDIKGKGHQPHQAKIAAGSGQVFGLGFGESLQKLEYLPEARSDYIAAIYAEECGFVGVFALIVVYMMLAYAGFHIAAKAQTLPGFYTAAIFTFLICFQAFLNLGVVSGLLPSKGTNLPFFSQGGSSLLANVLALGLILNIGRRQERTYEA